MFEPKTIPEGFPWVPLDQRPGLPPRKPELRKPALWLSRRGNELYLVNALDEALNEVLVGGEFGESSDEDFLCGSVPTLTYRDVLPGAAVKVDEYDGYYDLDYFIVLKLIVRSPCLGQVYCHTGDMGEIKETVLLWANGDIGNGVFWNARESLHNPRPRGS